MIRPRVHNLPGRPAGPAQVVSAIAASIAARARRGLETTERDLMAEGFTVAEVADHGAAAVARTRTTWPTLAAALEECPA